MMKTFNLMLLMFLGVICKVLAQDQDSYDGIIIKNSKINSESFYFGEPFRLFFDIENTLNEVNYYHLPYTGINIQFFLRDLSTGKIINNLQNDWNNADPFRANIQNSKPDEKIAFQANEVRPFQMLVPEYFGLQRLSNKYERFQHNDLVYKLQTLPVGKYEFILKYYLYPSSHVISASHVFEIKEVPSNEIESFKHYIETTEYACENHFWGTKKYSSKHPKSYENYIARFPESIYTEYAFIDMVQQIYSYYGPPEDEMIAKYNEFINFYPKINRVNNKMLYGILLPDVVKKIPGKNVPKEMDKFLFKIKDEQAELSEITLNVAKNKNIKGLKNYNKEK